MEKEKDAQEKEPFSLKKEILSWIWIIVVAAAIAFFLNTFIIANSRVPSGSMENTIMTGDRVIGSRLSYKFHEPERGDIAIFHFPDDPTGKTLYVKRIIGLPGETVDIVDSQVYINGEPLDEPYLDSDYVKDIENNQGYFTSDFEAIELGSDEYFVMGDNRVVSADSRVVGPFSRSQIVGKGVLVLLPLDQLGYKNQ